MNILRLFLASILPFLIVWNIHIAYSPLYLAQSYGMVILNYSPINPLTIIYVGFAVIFAMFEIYYAYDAAMWLGRRIQRTTEGPGTS